MEVQGTEIWLLKTAGCSTVGSTYISFTILRCWFAGLCRLTGPAVKQISDLWEYGS